MAGRLRDTFFFDLDGTLLPLDMDEFIREYYLGIDDSGVCGAICKDKGHEIFQKAVFAMMENDGSKTNKQAFFEELQKLSGIGEEKLMPLMDKFYNGEYKKIKKHTGIEYRAAEIIEILKEKGYRLVLATNPLFPPVATNLRMRWGGLDKDDFEYITYYDNSSFCKPKHGYYQEILDKLGLKAQQCYIVGNDVRDDMSAVALGFEGFLVTDHLIGDIGKVPECRKGDYSELLNFVKKLPEV